MIHLYNGIKIKFTSKWMELEKKIMSEVTQTQNGKYDVYLLIYVC